MQRSEVLAKLSDEPGKITRTFGSPAMRRANDQVARWMRQSGMKTRRDAIGNLIGHYAGKTPAVKTLLLGSHLDTVPNAGKFDGPLGVLLAIACVEHLHRRKIRLPFAIEVVGFADEEGVRFDSAYLGSQALAGCFDRDSLRLKDANGVSLADAIRQFGGDPAKIRSARFNLINLAGYLEAHIEQGPVLEQKHLAVGVVTTIVGQTRARINFIGRAGHAGTTPMTLRQDALCSAAEFIQAAESVARRSQGLVATIGEISVRPGASNVIPGKVRLSLDLRHAHDAVRKSAYRQLYKIARQIARRRKVRFDGKIVHETASVNCSESLSGLLSRAAKRRQGRVIRMTSGAGHDAAVMAGITQAAMLFIRCRGGISHHPDESVKAADVRMALDVMNDFVQMLAKKYRQTHP